MVQSTLRWLTDSVSSLIGFVIPTLSILLIILFDFGDTGAGRLYYRANFSGK